MTQSEIMKIAKPILFNGEMVRAILEDRKTATRRAIKPQPENAHMILGPGEEEDGTFEFMCGGYNGVAFMDWIETVKMPYQPGDCLYVRETWAPINPDGKFDTGGYIYRADDLIYFSACGKRYSTGRGYQWSGIWRPSIHMPKEAARIFLQVTDVKVEHLQDITEEGALSEGVPDDWPMDAVYCPRCKGDGLIGTMNSYSLGYKEADCPDCRSAIIRFRNLWDSTVKRKDFDKYSWEANPWVWAIEFEKMEV